MGWGRDEGKVRGGDTLRLGVSIPAVTMRLEMTKQDMRKGRKTGWPVSVAIVSIQLDTFPISCGMGGREYLDAV